MEGNGRHGDGEVTDVASPMIPIEVKNSVKKKLQPRGLDSCNTCVRYVLILGNCIFFFLGCTVIGLGIYIVIDKVNFVTAIFGIPLVAPASYLIIASGCAVFLISFVGCFGALFESRSLLIIYSTALSIVLVLSCVGFILALLFRSKVTDQIQEYMQRTLQHDYGVKRNDPWNSLVTESWDNAQTKWQCCSVADHSWSIYSQSAWFENQVGVPGFTKPLVPETCCKRNENREFINREKCQLSSNGPPGMETGEENNALNYKGCYEAGKLVLNEISGYLVCIGVVMASVVVGAFLFSASHFGDLGGYLQRIVGSESYDALTCWWVRIGYTTCQKSLKINQR